MTDTPAKNTVPHEKLIQRQVATRWTSVLVENGWVPVSHFFLDHYRDLSEPLTSSEVLLVIHLMRYKWTEAAPYPSFKRLANRMGVTDTAVRNHARSLEKKGYLRRIERLGGTNKFDLEPLFAALEKLKTRLDQEKTLARKEGDVVEALRE